MMTGLNAFPPVHPLVRRRTLSRHPRQKEIFDTIVNGDGGCVFVDAPAGSGKTMLSKALLARVRGKENIALATAMSTDIAACLLPGGTTAHSRFKLQINPQDQPPRVSLSVSLSVSFV